MEHSKKTANALAELRESFIFFFGNYYKWKLRNGEKKDVEDNLNKFSSAIKDLDSEFLNSHYFANLANEERQIYKEKFSFLKSLLK